MLNPMPSSPINQPIPEWKLKLSYFYASHQIVIKKALIFLLFFIDILVVFTFGSTFLNYQTGLIADQKFLRTLPLDLVNYSDYKAAHQPKDLEFGPVNLVPSGNNYDIVAAVTNSNQNWMVTALTYSFTVNGADLSAQTVFILPKSSKYLINFNLPKANTAAVKIINIDWRRVTDFSLLSYQNSVKITDSRFVRAASASIGGELSLTVYNDSPYSFWEVGLPIILRDRSSKIIGANYVVINQLMAKEKRDINIGWLNPIESPVGQVEVMPEINLLNDDVIIKISAPPGSPPGKE